MNFFQSQDVARKNTRFLVFLFVSAVILLIAMTNLLVMGFTVFTQSPDITTIDLKTHFDWKTFAIVSAGVITLVTLASLFKIMQLSGGGERVAEMMGGELIVDADGDLHKQRVLNIVEEMAIASGTPVPPVYLMHENAINAFAAGTTPGNAVIGVTTGTIKKLSRDQLQGVIAHEFSHIHNGDMQLNIRLIGLLNGILIIGIIGYLLLRSSMYRGHSRNSKGGGGAIIGLGIGLMVVGYAGTFFGNIIKAAVSRQREYLADASAVQFTRNKNGIAGALKRIGGHAEGSIMQSPSSAEISHTLFGQGITTMFTGLFATHPPLEKRIRAIQPDWDGEFETPPEIDQASSDEINKPRTDKTEKTRHAIITGATIMAGHAAMEDVIGSVGQPSADHLSYAQNLISTLPDVLRHAAHSPFTARAVIYYLVLDKNPDMRESQLNYLKETADTGIYEETLKLSDQAPDLNDAYRLPLVEIALSPLRQLSMRQYELFKENLDALVKMDDKISLFEWSLQKIVFHHLDSAFNKKHSSNRTYTIKKLTDECSLILSFLIYAGKQNNIEEKDVFEKAKNTLGNLDAKLIKKSELNLDNLNLALDKLAQLKPLKKPQLLKACAACITADEQITTTEAELFRAISDTLDCPMPPLIIQ